MAWQSLILQFAYSAPNPQSHPSMKWLQADCLSEQWSGLSPANLEIIRPIFSSSIWSFFVQIRARDCLSPSPSLWLIAGRMSWIPDSVLLRFAVCPYWLCEVYHLRILVNFYSGNKDASTVDIQCHNFWNNPRFTLNEVKSCNILASSNTCGLPRPQITLFMDTPSDCENGSEK